MRYWSPAELQTFLAFVREDRLYPVWRLAAATGFRRGELLGLRWDEDIDLDAGTVSVRQATVKVRGGTVTGPPKTDRSRRTITLDAGTVAVLRRWKLIGQNEERLAAGERWMDTGYVVTMPDGRRQLRSGCTAGSSRRPRRLGCGRSRSTPCAIRT